MAFISVVSSVARQPLWLIQTC